MTARITAEQVLPLWVTALKALGLPLRTPYPPERGSAAQYYVAKPLIDYLCPPHVRDIAKALGYEYPGVSLFKSHRIRWRRANLPIAAILDACALAFETGKVVTISVPVWVSPNAEALFSGPVSDVSAPVEPAQVKPEPEVAAPAPSPARTIADIAGSVAKTFPVPQKKPVAASPKKSEPTYPDTHRGRPAHPPQHPPITTFEKPRSIPELKPDGSNMYAVPLRSRRPDPRYCVSVPVPGDKPEGWKPPNDEGYNVAGRTRNDPGGLNRRPVPKTITLPRIRALEGRDDG